MNLKELWTDYADENISDFIANQKNIKIFYSSEYDNTFNYKSLALCKYLLLFHIDYSYLHYYPHLDKYLPKYLHK